MNLIAALFQPILGLITDFFKGRQEIQAARQKVIIAAEENKARLLSQEQSNNHNWEMAQLVDSDRWLRRICFFIFSFPFIYAAFDADQVAYYFDHAISAIPEWYVQIYAGIVGAVWGISALKNVLPPIVSTIKNAVIRPKKL